MAADVSLFNLASQENRQTYIRTLSAIRNNLESLNVGIKNLDCNVQTETLTQVLAGGERFVIYGAGKLAEVFVKYLLFIKCIDRERIKIVVSQKSYIQDMLCGMKINELSELTKKDETFVYVIAVDNKSLRNEMTSNLRKKRIENVIEIDFECMLALIKMGETF